MQQPRRIALLLRGHVRDAFKNDTMRNFVHDMQHDDRLSVDLYVQTWDHDEALANCSWRVLDYNRKLVTSEMIDEYLRCKSNQRILQDGQCDLIGTTDGMIGGTSKRGWKQMWLGIYTMVDVIKCSGISYDAVVSVRFDFFGGYVSGRHHGDYGVDITPCYVKEWILRSSSTGCLCFLSNHASYGIDNCYVGPTYLVHRLCSMFHTDLDSTCESVGHEWNQERMVYKLAMILNEKQNGSAEDALVDPIPSS
jgi:hypothetical protein